MYILDNHWTNRIRWNYIIPKYDVDVLTGLVSWDIVDGIGELEPNTNNTCSLYWHSWFWRAHRYNILSVYRYYGIPALQKKDLLSSTVGTNG